MKKILILVGLILLLAAGVFFIIKKFYFPKFSPEISIQCSEGWKAYQHDVLGIKFCYPNAWGDPATEPIEYLTKLPGVVDKYSKTGDNNYDNSLFIGFPNSDVSLRFFNDKYSGEYYPNGNAYGFGHTDNIAILKESKNICDYKIDFPKNGDYEQTLEEIWSECQNQVKVNLVEQDQYFESDYFKDKYLYSYSLNAYAFKNAKNGYFDNVLVKLDLGRIHQNRQKLTSLHQPLDEFFNKTLDSDVKEQPRGTLQEFQAKRAEFEKFISFIETFQPVPKTVSPFQVNPGENPDVTAIRHYYYYLANNQLQNAYNMYSQASINFSEYEKQYKEVIKADPRDFIEKGNHQYEFYVDYQENNTKPTVYHVKMLVNGGKIQTLLSEEITTPLVKFGQYVAYAKTIGKKNYMVLLDNGKEYILDQAYNDYDMKGVGLANVEFYSDVEFSPSGKYLYHIMSGWEWSEGYVYDTKSKKRILTTDSGSTHGFVDDDKYFYACTAPGMGGGYGLVFALPTGRKVFDIYRDKRNVYYEDVSCEYSKENSEVSFMLKGYQDRPTRPDKVLKFSF